MLGNKEIMAENIKHYMAKKGVNAAEVCSALGFKTNTFSDWVTAKSYPRIDKIEAMAKYFEVPKAMLVEDMKEYPVDLLLTDEEKQILIEFRHATPQKRDQLLAYWRFLNQEEGK